MDNSTLLTTPQATRFDQASGGQKPGDHVSHRTNRLLEVSSSSISVTVSAALALYPQHTYAWIWLSWGVANLMMIAWGWRVRAWGILAMNGAFLLFDGIGLARLKGWL